MEQLLESESAVEWERKLEWVTASESAQEKAQLWEEAMVLLMAQDLESEMELSLGLDSVKESAQG